MRLPFLLLALLFDLAGCGSGTRTAVTVDNPWIRLAAVAGRPAAGYATVAASTSRGALIRVSSPRAEHVEMHETMTHGSMTGMRPVDRIEPGGKPIIFGPGGHHLMLFGVDPRVRPGGKTDLVFHFERGSPVTVAATVVAAGDPAPF